MQYDVLVGIIISMAILYAVIVVVRKRRSFSLKAGCDNDCGCNGSGKKLTS